LISSLDSIPAELQDPIPPSNDEDKSEVRAAVFNVVDGEDTDQSKMAEIVKEVVGVGVGWKGSVVNMLAKVSHSLVERYRCLIVRSS
jgi:hypothetical protein